MKSRIAARSGGSTNLDDEEIDASTITSHIPNRSTSTPSAVGPVDDEEIDASTIASHTPNRSTSTPSAVGPVDDEELNDAAIDTCGAVNHTPNYSSSTTSAQVILNELSQVQGLDQIVLLKAVDLMKHDKLKFEVFCELPQEFKRTYILMHLNNGNRERISLYFYILAFCLFGILVGIVISKGNY